MEASFPVIRLMQAEDIEQAMLLKTMANWNQTELDWDRLLRLEPDGCFVDERDGVVVGTTTALRHGTELAWIGMVLVPPAFRRRGIARGLVRHALAWLSECGNAVVGLDATSMGYSLYCQLGFRDVEWIERWERLPDRKDVNAGRKASAALRDCLLALDREACGYDRSTLLRDLWNDPSVECTHCDRGFAFGRPGSMAWYVGPCIARSEGDAEAVLHSILAPHAGELVYWDLLPASQPARRLALRLGFRRARRLMRMLREDRASDPREFQPSQVYAAAGFEFG